MIYVTERCVFQLTPGGLELIEVARGIDIEKDILAQMDFEPVINKPVPMDRRIFIDEPMDLLSDLLNLKLWERVSYDADRNILFLNLEGWSVRKKSDIEDLTKVLIDACEKAGKRVNAVVNHDGCRIAEDLYDDYADMIQYMLEHHYATTTRYTTSTFMRLKMEQALNKRGLAPHIYERADEAHDAVGDRVVAGVRIGFLDVSVRLKEGAGGVQIGPRRRPPRHGDPAVGWTAPTAAQAVPGTAGTRKKFHGKQNSAARVASSDTVQSSICRGRLVTVDSAGFRRSYLRMYVHEDCNCVCCCLGSVRIVRDRCVCRSR
ncbi:MAG: hypothetical protein A49_09750 [Methyloceanibacter sp.]|nr:MAG: hypothetical protein A49_09750 [Methyloceanibacter sp.]